jgi:F-type H+-transporting ATPase subunit delta
MKSFGSYLEKAYAGVLFELADEHRLLDVVKEDLDFWTELCGAENDFEKLFFSPYFSSGYKQQLVGKILSEKIADLTMNFLKVVIKHNRTTYLPQIIAKYHNLWETRQGYCPVEVTVARVMDAGEVGKLSTDISSAINRRIKLELSVDPSIIGGVIIRYDDKVVDNTVRGKLQKAVETIIRRGKSKKINEV